MTRSFLFAPVNISVTPVLLLNFCFMKRSQSDVILCISRPFFRSSKVRTTQVIQRPSGCLSPPPLSLPQRSLRCRHRSAHPLSLARELLRLLRPPENTYESVTDFVVQALAHRGNGSIDRAFMSKFQALVQRRIIILLKITDACKSIIIGTGIASPSVFL